MRTEPASTRSPASASLTDAVSTRSLASAILADAVSAVSLARESRTDAASETSPSIETGPGKIAGWSPGWLSLGKGMIVLRLLFRRPSLYFKRIVSAMLAFGYSRAKHYGW